MGKYDDIINLPHHVSATRPHMPMIDRAAQFTPFQALTGYGEAIQETARITGEKVELTEDEKTVLDEKLRLLTDTGNEAEFTYFQPDGKKSGGVYVTVLGAIKKLDPLEGRLVLADGATIPIDDILEIEDGVSVDHPFREETS